MPLADPSRPLQTLSGHTVPLSSPSGTELRTQNHEITFQDRDRADGVSRPASWTMPVACSVRSHSNKKPMHKHTHRAQNNRMADSDSRDHASRPRCCHWSVQSSHLDYARWLIPEISLDHGAHVPLYSPSLGQHNVQLRFTRSRLPTELRTLKCPDQQLGSWSSLSSRPP